MKVFLFKKLVEDPRKCEKRGLNLGGSTTTEKCSTARIR